MAIRGGQQTSPDQTLVTSRADAAAPLFPLLLSSRKKRSQIREVAHFLAVGGQPLAVELQDGELEACGWCKATRSVNIDGSLAAVTGNGEFGAIRNRSFNRALPENHRVNAAGYLARRLH